MFQDSIYEKIIHYLIGTKFTDHISATFQFLYFWKKSSCTFSGYKRKTKSLITNGFVICGMRRHPEHWKHLKTQESHWLSLALKEKYLAAELILPLSGIEMNLYWVIASSVETHSYSHATSFAIFDGMQTCPCKPRWTMGYSLVWHPPGRPNDRTATHRAFWSYCNSRSVAWC